ncbi:MAG TPA: TIM barrel protein [Candidatus Didemnitutus sp.]|nr:TIM barrel protein [Candidatus Didemnitutus sp.]
MNSFRHSVSQWCFPDIPLSELAKAVRPMGIESIELLEPADWPVVRAHGLVCALGRGPDTISDSFNRRENHARLVPAFQQRLRECAAAGVPNVVCFSGNRRGQSDEEGMENCAEGFRRLADDAERLGVTLCLELLNSKIDHPDYQCDNTAWGVELCQRVGSERVKLLFDIYHMAVMGEDVMAMIRTHHRWFAHYHTAGLPGRHEIDGGQTLDYPAIMRAIHATGHRGFVGQEFLPLRDPLTSLREAVRICTV